MHAGPITRRQPARLRPPLLPFLDHPGHPCHRSRVAERESFEVFNARLKAEHAKMEKAIRDAFAQSPAVMVISRDRRQDALFILSGDMVHGEGLRVSFFDRRGPYSHTERPDFDSMVEELVDHQLRGAIEIRPASEEEVMAWTETEEFAEGALHTAWMQASNDLRYIAGKLGREASDWARQTELAARRIWDYQGMLPAIRMLEQAVQEAMDEVSAAGLAAAEEGRRGSRHVVAPKVIELQLNDDIAARFLTAGNEPVVHQTWVLHPTGEPGRALAQVQVFLAGGEWVSWTGSTAARSMQILTRQLADALNEAEGRA